MEKQFTITSETPQVVLEVQGDLSLKGADELEVAVKTDSTDDLTLEQRDDTVYVRCLSNCSVRVPREAVLEVDAVRGNAAFKGLEGELSIQVVNGNLTLRNVGPTRIDRVNGELSAKHITGDFNINTVDGNATVRDVEGAFVVDGAIHGNLSLGDVEGDLSAKVQGNATLRLDPLPGQKYDFTTDGNLLCRLPEDTSVKVHFLKAANVAVQFKDVDASQVKNAPYDLTIGDGDAELTLSASGNILLASQAPEWEMPRDFGADFGAEFENMAETFSQQFSQQIEAQMELLGRQLEEKLGNLSTSFGAMGLSPEDAERISQRAREASERASARAQERLHRAQERLERKMAAAQHRAEQRARAAERHAHAHEKRAWSFDWSASKPPEPPGEPVSDEERLAILRMLEEKKITLEEAEQLLAALEGGKE